MSNVKRGEIYFADLGPVIGSEQGGIRPVIILQNDIGNRYSPTTIVASISSQTKPTLPVHVKIHKTCENGLSTNSVVLLEQLRTIDKRRLKDRVGRMDEQDMEKVLEALKVSVPM